MTNPVFSRREIANTGVNISAIGLGTVKFGRNQSVKYPGDFDLPDDKSIESLLGIAMDAGINTLDTAPAYGLSEKRLGQLLKNRQSWHIITKAGEYYNKEKDQSHYDFTPKSLRLSLENSLRTLRTDYIDCWLLHSDGNDLTNLSDEVIQTFLKAKQDGLVRSVGASTKTVEGGELALKHLDCIMMAASLENTEETPLFDFAASNGKSLLIKKIYDSGWALDKQDKNKIMNQTFEKLFSNKACCSAVIGTINPIHLQENISLLKKILEEIKP